MDRPPTCRMLLFQATSLAVLGITLACGIRGAPLAPLVSVPTVVMSFEVQRFDDRVFIQFKVPSENTDGTAPADLERVDVYGLTTQSDPTGVPQLPFEEWFEYATLVASIPVEALMSEAPPDFDQDSEIESESAQQGEEVVLVEALTPEILIPPVIESDQADDRDDEESLGMSENPPVSFQAFPSLPESLRRTYVAVAVSTRGRRSSPSPRVDVTLAKPTPPPVSLVVTYTESEILIAWTASPAARLPVQKRANGSVLESRPTVEPPPPTRYLVYAVKPNDVLDGRDVSRLVSATLGAETSAVDSAITFGVKRCYVVRALDEIDSLPVRGPASSPECIVPIDMFAPQSPTSVIAVASRDAIGLAWEPSPEADILGYLVLRRLAVGATLEPLTPEPIVETTYRDTDVESGRRYLYAIQAVDNATPPNISPPSADVAERAR